jgi:putative FmdB family regulatory protein
MLYKFNCEQCGEKELDLKVSECNLDVCPDCGSKMTRIFGTPTAIWKCSGDYNGTRGGR